MKNVDILVISISSPLSVGIYEDSKLIDVIQSDKKASDSLIEILENLLINYTIKRVIYTNSPGSFMGLKVAYIILKTFCMIKGYDFLSVDGFALNGGMPIKANKALCFVKNGEDIILDQAMPVEPKMPNSLLDIKLSVDTLPKYIIKAV